MSPLDPLGTFYREPEIEAELQRTVEAGPRGRVPGLSELDQEPVATNGIASLLEEGHYNFGRAESNVNPVSRISDCHITLNVYPLIRTYPPSSPW